MTCQFFDGVALRSPAGTPHLSILSRREACPRVQKTGSNLANVSSQMDTLSPIARFRSASSVAYRSICALTDREKKHLLQEILHIRGLMPLLMKPRNNKLWTLEDKEELKVHL